MSEFLIFQSELAELVRRVGVEGGVGDGVGGDNKLITKVKSIHKRFVSFHIPFAETVNNSKQPFISMSTPFAFVQERFKSL